MTRHDLLTRPGPSDGADDEIHSPVLEKSEALLNAIPLVRDVTFAGARNPFSDRRGSDEQGLAITPRVRMKKNDSEKLQSSRGEFTLPALGPAWRARVRVIRAALGQATVTSASHPICRICRGTRQRPPAQSNKVRRHESGQTL